MTEIDDFTRLNEAKQIFFKWCCSPEWADGDYCSIKTHCISENNSEDCISWRCSSSNKVLFNYPIVVEYVYFIDSINNNWDEVRWNQSINKQIYFNNKTNIDFFNDDTKLYNHVFDNFDENNPNDFVPTEEQCLQNDLIPIFTFDAVLTHKGSPKYLIDFFYNNKPKIYKKTIKKLKDSGFDGKILQISVDWILKQRTIPNKLNVRKWLF